MGELLRSGSLDTVNDPETVVVLDTGGLHRVAVEAENTGPAGALVTVEASVSGRDGHWTTVVAEATVDADAVHLATVPAADEPYKLFRVRAKNEVADTPTTVLARIYAK